MEQIILFLFFLGLVFCADQEFQTQSLVYTRTPHVDDVVQRKSLDSPYNCPNNYVYLYRDLQIFSGIVCVDTAITEVELHRGECSDLGWATISFNEVSANTQQYCNLLLPGEVARVGFMGSLSGNGCSLMDWDPTGVPLSICVKRVINNVELVFLNGLLCGEGMILVTPQEAQANQDAYCSLLETYDIVRLGNGGSMDGSGYYGGTECKIRYEDRRDLNAVLCRALQNSEVVESVNHVVINSQAVNNSVTTTTIIVAEEPLN